MVIMHEGSCLFIPRSDGTRLMLAEDMTLTEACEFMLNELRLSPDGNSKAIAGLPVRKVAYPRIPAKRRQSATGWPKV